MATFISPPFATKMRRQDASGNPGDAYPDAKTDRRFAKTDLLRRDLLLISRGRELERELLFGIGQEVSMRILSALFLVSWLAAPSAPLLTPQIQPYSPPRVCGSGC
jgi:hypothetical protein